MLLCAGRLVGNIRSQGTVKRTVIRGRVGARPAGMRLPPPMSSEAVPNSTATAAAAGATNTAGGEHDKTEAKSAKGENKVCPFQCNLALLEHQAQFQHWKAGEDKLYPARPCKEACVPISSFGVEHQTDMHHQQRWRGHQLAVVQDISYTW